MFDLQLYSDRVIEAEERAERAPTAEIRQSWLSVKQGWEWIVRIHQEILADRPTSAAGKRAA